MCWEVGHPLKRDGTSQRQRPIRELIPDNYPLDARTETDFLIFTRKLAAEIAHYDTQNQLSGDWQAFFPDGNSEEIEALLRSYIQEQELPPHLALFVVFLRLFRHAQEELNSLTEKHLSFYYEEVLLLTRKPPLPDELHVVFQLAKQAEPALVPAGSRLFAGKDVSGKLRHYVTQEEIVVSPVEVTALKALWFTGATVYAAPEANSRDGVGTPFRMEPHMWPPFGEPLFHPEGELGFAIASPMFFLSGGTRRITIWLEYTTSIPLGSSESALLRRHLSVFASGKKDWIPLTWIDSRQSGSAVILELEILPAQPSTVSLNDSSIEESYDTPFPVLKFTLNRNADRPLLSEMMSQNISGITIEVDVQDLPQIVLQNDLGPLDTSGKIQPFGSTPIRGSRFYVGSPEAFNKSLQSVRLRLPWLNVPSSTIGFPGHYVYYSEGITSNEGFQVTADALVDGHWENLTPLGGIPMFTPENIRTPRDIKLSLDTSPPDTELSTFRRYEAGLPAGFIRLTLNRDFLHQQYVRQKGVFVLSAGTREFSIPLQLPYTPELEEVFFSYTARERIFLNSSEQRGSFFHLWPFGSVGPLMHHSAVMATPLLPTLSNGQLLIGIQPLSPPQNLMLHFQVAEGSANSDALLSQGEILWSYWGSRGWTYMNAPTTAAPLPQNGQIFTDTTLELQQSGIIGFQLGRDAQTLDTWTEDPMYWLKAELQRNDPRIVPRMVAIQAQAVSAIFQDEGNDPQHYELPLAAEEVKRLTEQINGIKKVVQPFPSVGGRPAEQGLSFFARVSERLRHKQRAIAIWDYEHLVLEAFPEIYKTKCISHTGWDEENYYSEFQPGQVTVVVIPYWRLETALNPLKPNTSAGLRQRIYEYLLPHTTYFLLPSEESGRLIEVVNPKYETILLDFKVGFRAGRDPAFYRNRLNEDLRRLLSPWAYDEGANLSFGGKVFRSQLLAFVENRPYVDYVTDFRLWHRDAGPGIGEMCIAAPGPGGFSVGPFHSEPLEVAVPSTARSILVSAEAHRIHPLLPGEYPCDDSSLCEGGIGCMYVDIDFILDAD